MMHAARQQPIAPEKRSSVGAQLDAVQHLISVAVGQMDDLRERLAPQQPAPPPTAPALDASTRLVLEACREALRLARGCPAAPSTRNKIQAAYTMCCTELEAQG